jgi:hypothetical protein
MASTVPWFKCRPVRPLSDSSVASVSGRGSLALFKEEGQDDRHPAYEHAEQSRLLNGRVENIEVGGCGRRPSDGGTQKGEY